MNAASCSSDGPFSHLTGLAGSQVLILVPCPPDAPGSSSPRSVGAFSCRRLAPVIAWEEKTAHYSVTPKGHLSGAIHLQTCCQSGEIKFGEKASICVLVTASAAGKEDDFILGILVPSQSYQRSNVWRKVIRFLQDLKHLNIWRESPLRPVEAVVLMERSQSQASTGIDAASSE